MPGNAERWASMAVEKLTAKSVEAGQYDLILEPTNLWLTIHESIGHPTELDRAIGEEANYAGTSFVAPPEKMIGQLKYGPAFMNVQADRTQEGSLVARRLGRRGRARRSVADRREGHLQGLPDHARAGGADPEADRRGALARLLVRRVVGRGAVSAHAEHLAAARASRTSSLDDIVAATDRGIVIRNRGSWSIDHQRYNFQFSGQAFYEVRNGKIVGHAARRRLPGQHAGVLELDGHDRRQVVLLDGRRVQRRQGRAVAEQFGQPRLRAGPLPQRARSSTPRGTA